jgi:hypothetical protein
VAFKKGELPLSAVAKRQLTQRIKEFKGLSREQRKELLKETWQETAYTVALRASTFARFCNAREGGRLYQLIMAGAVSMDKDFPPKEQLDLNEVVNLFGSLGARGKAIVQPNVPQREGTTNTDLATVALTTGGAYISTTYATDPDTAGAWSTSAIDALEVGGIETAAVSTRLQDVHVYVEYTEAVASASGSLMLMGVGR